MANLKQIITEISKISKFTNKAFYACSMAFSCYKFSEKYKERESKHHSFIFSNEMRIGMIIAFSKFLI